MIIKFKLFLNDNDINKIYKNINKNIQVTGIVSNIRKFGKLNFLILILFDEKYQKYYKLQCIVKNKKQILKIKILNLVNIFGKLIKRNNKFIRNNQIFDNIEININKIQSYDLNNKKKKYPFNFINDISNIDTYLKNNFRFLSLRNINRKKILKIKSNFYYYATVFFQKNNFIQINTPILTKDSREGSNVFNVSSPFNKNKKFALSQSPQIYKQSLMSAYFYKYFQFANTCRNENIRKDRQPEFEQLDIEVSFTNEKKIMKIMEKFLRFVLMKIDKDIYINKKFPILSYDKVIKIFNTDEPNIIWIKKDKNNIFFSKVLKIEKKDLIFFDQQYINQYFIKLKLKYNKKYQYICKKYLSFINNKWQQFIWINKFPMFKVNRINNKIVTFRHLFTKLRNEKIILKSNNIKRSKLLNLRTFSYDLVFNGREIASGSLRNEKYEIQKKIFDIININLKNEFDFFLNMLSYSCPKHGGWALGIDRLIMKIYNLNNLDKIIAFPKNDKFECCLTKAPN